MNGPIKDYVCVDLETTGLYPKYDRIIEIGALKVENGQTTDTFQTLVNPGRRLSEKTRQLTGIRDEELEKAPVIEEVLPDFLRFAKEHVLLGHSLLFDYSFLKKAAVNMGLPFEASGVDTLRLSRKFLADLPSRSLPDLCRHFQIEHTAHRALGDAAATSRLYEVLCDRYYNEKDFVPAPLIFRVKKEGPASRAQKERLYRMIAEKGIDPGMDVERLTRNEASRLTDRILSGRLWEEDKTEEKQNEA